MFPLCPSCFSYWQRVCILRAAPPVSPCEGMPVSPAKSLSETSPEGQASGIQSAAQKGGASLLSRPHAIFNFGKLFLFS